ncbi:histidinol-phosphate aminotransferase [Desulfitispora alkaliphila]|uniref:histidinol-phosphate transaminase n=1 Tax=Desulfitispora alkaliphila TaxID=622674 RepID=UPI003D219080
MEGKDLARKNLMELTPYQPGKPIEEVERELGISNVIKMASNENPYGPSQRAQEAMQKAIQQANMYPDGNCYYLKQLLCEKLNVEMDQLALGNGSNELIKLISKAYLSQGDEIVMADPSFSEYKTAAIISGAKAVEVPLTEEYKHDLDKMAAAIGPKTKLVYICNPNNPTGTLITASELSNFLEKLPEHVILIMDEAYFEYVSSEENPDSVAEVKKGKNIIVLRTFSKMYSLAALRVGYAIARPDIIDFINRVREPFNVNNIAQAAATASLQSEEHVEKSVKLNEAGKEYLMAELQKIGLNPISTETNFIFVDTGVDSKELFQRMLKKGVIIRSGDIFGNPTFVRLTIGFEQDNERMVKVLAETIAEMK